MTPSLRCALTVAFCASCLAITPVADGSSVRECGDLSLRAMYNITARAVNCAEARRVVRAWSAKSSQVRVRGLTCRYRDTGYEAGDIRCTGSGGRVVHWQTGV